MKRKRKKLKTQYRLQSWVSYFTIFLWCILPSPVSRSTQGKNNTLGNNVLMRKIPLSGSFTCFRQIYTCCILLKFIWMSTYFSQRVWPRRRLCESLQLPELLSVWPAAPDLWCWVPRADPTPSRCEGFVTIRLVTQSLFHLSSHYNLLTRGSSYALKCG